MLTTPQLLSLFPQPLPLLHVLDVGAMFMDEGDEPYHDLVRDGLARVTGFEPVPRECEVLRQKFPPPHQFLPYVIGDGSERTFHLCNESMTSSLYEPNRPLLEMFHKLYDVHQVVHTEPVRTVRLDDIEQCRDVDYLKLDVQGAELDVLRGGERTLSDALLIHTEVEFVPMYKGQPLFAEVDAFVRARGFMFHRFAGTAGRPFRPMYIKEREYDPISQQLWAEVLYVRDFTRLDLIAPTGLLKLAAMLHHHRSVDLAAVMLAEYDRRHPTQLSPLYLSRIGTHQSA